MSRRGRQLLTQRRTGEGGGWMDGRGCVEDGRAGGRVDGQGVFRGIVTCAGSPQGQCGVGWCLTLRFESCYAAPVMVLCGCVEVLVSY